LSVAAKPTPKKAAASKAQSARAARTVRVAAALVAGESQSAIAKTEGLSRTTVAAIATSSDCLLLIASAVDQFRDRLVGAVQQSFDAIDDAFQARKEYYDKEAGRAVTGGPDHYARLAAVKAATQLAVAGRPAPKHPEKTTDNRKLTLEELERAVQERQQ
jgi:hypothetical protein